MATVATWATSTQGVSAPVGVATDGTYLYVASSGGTGVINRILLSNPSTYTASFIATGYGLNVCYSICTDGTYLYTCSLTKIDKWSLSTGAIVTANWATLSTTVNIITASATDGTYLYIMNNLSICQILLSNPTTQNNSWFTGLALPTMTFYNGSIYAFKSSNIIKIPVSNPAGYTTVITSATGNYGLATDGYYVYMTVQNNNRVDLGIIPAGTVVATSYATGLSSPCGCTFFGKYLYVANFGASTISTVTLLSIPCFKEGSQILTDNGYVPVEKLRKGDRVKTLLNGYVPIYGIGHKQIQHWTSSKGTDSTSENQLYECLPERYPELTEPLVITGFHSVLVEEFGEGEREHTERIMEGRIYLTDGLYRLPVCVDKRSVVYDKPGTYTIYHFALEHDDYFMNYGVYANGLLVETCSKRYLMELSGMELLYTF